MELKQPKVILKEKTHPSTTSQGTSELLVSDLTVQDPLQRKLELTPQQTYNIGKCKWCHYHWICK